MPIEPVGNAQGGDQASKIRQAIAVSRSAQQKIQEGSRQAGQAVRAAGNALKPAEPVVGRLRDAVSISSSAQRVLNEGARRAVQTVQDQLNDAPPEHLRKGASIDVLA